MKGRPRRYSEPRVQLGLRLPAELAERLKVEATARGVSANRYLEELITTELGTAKARRARRR